MSRSRKQQWITQQKPRRIKRMTPIIAILLSLTGVSLMVLYKKHTTEARSAPMTSITPSIPLRSDLSFALRKAVETYILSHPASDSTDMWWLGENPPPLPVAKKLATEHAEQIVAILKQYRHKDPIIEGSVKLFSRGYRLGIWMSPDSIYRFNLDSRSLVAIDFTPKPVAEQRGGSPLTSTMDSAGYNRLDIWALNLPPKVLAAAAVHEAGHCYYNLSGKRATGNASPYEEVIMHTLGRVVFDTETGGGYSRLVRSIIQRSRRVTHSTSWKECINQVQLTDLKQVDRLLESQTISRDIAGSLSLHLALTIAFEVIDHSQLSFAQKEKEKVEAYKYVVENKYI